MPFLSSIGHPHYWCANPPEWGKLFEISQRILGSGVKGGRRPAERTLDAGPVEALRASWAGRPAGAGGLSASRRPSHASSQAVANAVGQLGTWVQSESYKAHVLADFMDSADPFLVGAALETRSVLVTQETPAGASRRKVKIPDACRHLGVQFENTFEMMRALGARFS